MRILRCICLLTFSGLCFGSLSLLSGCGDGGGSGSARFVPNEVNVEKVDGMSPSEAFHKNDKRRK